MAWPLVRFIESLQPAGGEPYEWFAGISIWPTETIRLVGILMTAFYLVKTIRALRGNEYRLEYEFGLTTSGGTLPPSTHPFGSKGWRAEWIERLSLRYWDDDRQVNASHLWNKYICSGTQRHRWLRILPLVILFVLAGIFLVQLLGWPVVPYRGLFSQRADRVFLACSVFASVLITFYVADATILNRRLIHYLARGVTEWPPETYHLTRRRKHWEPNPAYAPQPATATTPAGGLAPRPSNLLLCDYLDIELIAKRTATVSGLIYYPFVIISLMLLSRINLFDNWGWPAGLLMVMGGNACYAAWSAFRLRNTAEDARTAALERLGNLLIAYTVAGAGTEGDVATIRETMEAIRKERRGAFAPISQHPIFGAILLPSGGLGLWALTQYLPRFFG